MAIGIIPKSEPEKKETIHLESSFYYIGLMLFLFSFVASATLYFLSWRMESKFLEVERMLEERKSEEVLRLEREIDGHHRRLGDFYFIVNKKKFSSPIFRFLEENIHPGVYFSEFEANVQDGTIIAAGIARNLVAFDQQLQIFKESPMTRDVSAVTFVRERDGQITFPITITFDQALLERLIEDESNDENNNDDLQ